MDALKVRERPAVPSVDYAAKAQNVLLQDVDAGAPCGCGECEGFQLHIWRQICCNCRCPREAHMLDGNKLSAAKRMATLPRKGGKSVRATSKALIENWMNRLTEHQNPDYDSQRSAMRFVQTSEQQEKADHYLSQRQKDQRRNSKHDIAEKLQQFDRQNQLKEKELAQEFKSCDQCSQPITGQSYYQIENKTNSSRPDLHCCGRCYAEHHCPRCAGCDELIFDDEFTQAEGLDWHKGHFCCFECDKELAGQAYTMLEKPASGGEVEGLLEIKSDKAAKQPVCVDCYHSKHAPDCSSCNKTIEVSYPQLTLGGLHFHNNPACFNCKQCHKYLFSGIDGGKAVMLDDHLYCRKHAELMLQADVPKCRECAKPLEGECVKADGILYHEACFRCARCNVSLAECRSTGGEHVLIRGGQLNCGQPSCH
eukprot:m.198311 g.198311  ORF g.198311 m.198311 type:complete len:423 (-) comp17040_c0_seq2:3066-4334(-)